jgi:hypothetical protein
MPMRPGGLRRRCDPLHPAQPPLLAQLPLSRLSERMWTKARRVVVRFANKRATAEQWIREAKQAAAMMRRFRVKTESPAHLYQEVSCAS